MTELAVIMGAGPRLGRAVGAAFAAHGAQIVLIARNSERLRSIAAGIDGAVGLPVDVTDEPALRAAFASIRDQYGDPTVLIHNPSSAFEAPATETPLDVLMAGFRLAAGSLLVAAQEVAPAMRKARRGSILVTSNIAASTGSVWSATSAAQKAAVRNVALSLAAELGPDGIRVVTVVIDGVLGTSGFESDRIAARYVDVALGPASSAPGNEIFWPPR